MSKVVQQYIEKLNPRAFTNNVQRTLYRLLRTNGDWTRQAALRVPSVDRRISDVRNHGGFTVTCSRAEDVGRKRGFVYRLETKTVTNKI
jgi:hypothetical protein